MNRDSVVLLDRDGVINFDRDDYIKTPDEWIPIPGSLEAIAKLYQANFRVFIITNQSGVGRGLYTLETMHLIHEKMLTQVNSLGGSIEHIYFCPHHPDENCDCRKPKTGMLRQLVADHNVSLENAPFVGDTLKDVQAALSMKADPKVVLSGKGRREIDIIKKQMPEVDIFKDLASFVSHYLSNIDQ